MAYCDLDDILGQSSEEELIRLTDDAGDGVVNQTNLAKAIAKAATVIDSECGVRYTVPFDPVPEIIREAAVDLAIYNLYARRSLDMPETRKKGCDDAIARLKRIGQGLASINGAVATPSQTPTAADGGKVSAPARLFGPDTLAKF